MTEGVQLAAQLISQGVQVAQQTKRYIHLVDNGSVKMWHAIRPLMRAGRWMLIHESLSAVLAAVKELDGHLLWKATLECAMAQCAAAVRCFLHLLANTIILAQQHSHHVYFPFAILWPQLWFLTVGGPYCGVHQ